MHPSTRILPRAVHVLECPNGVLAANQIYVIRSSNGSDYAQPRLALGVMHHRHMKRKSNARARGTPEGRQPHRRVSSDSHVGYQGSMTIVRLETRRASHSQPSCHLPLACLYTSPKHNGQSSPLLACCRLESPPPLELTPQSV